MTSDGNNFNDFLGIAYQISCSLRLSPRPPPPETTPTTQSGGWFCGGRYSDVDAACGRPAVGLQDAAWPSGGRRRIYVRGVGDNRTCGSDARLRDSWIFLLHRDHVIDGDQSAASSFRLNSSLVRITLTNIDRIEALVAAQPTRPVPPREPANCQTWNWVIGSVGHLGHLSRPGHRVTEPSF